MTKSQILEMERQRRARQRAMSIDEFCKGYGIGRTKAYEEINAGLLKARKAGTRTLIGVDAAEEWWHSLPELQEALDESPLEIQQAAVCGIAEGCADSDTNEAHVDGPPTFILKRSSVGEAVPKRDPAALPIEFWRERFAVVDGVLVNRERTPSAFKSERDCNAWNTRFAGKPAGSPYRGDRRVAIDDVGMVGTKKIIAAIETGAWPGEKDSGFGSPLKPARSPARTMTTTPRKSETPGTLDPAVPPHDADGSFSVESEK
jgi:hypothetical protein